MVSLTQESRVAHVGSGIRRSDEDNRTCRAAGRHYFFGGLSAFCSRTSAACSSDA